MKKVIVTIVCLISTIVYSQEIEEIQVDVKQKFNNIEHNKGRMFFYWGWNRSTYSTSDITFKGRHYNFTLYNVKAEDKPKPFGIEFLNPGKLTIPQNNYRIGYFFSDHYNVSLGVDHMKYVMRNDQTVPIKGYIYVGSEYDGMYGKGDEIYLDEDFLTFEHTDGLNYVSAEISRFDAIDNWIGFNIRHIDINLSEGVGVGLIYPKTNTQILGEERYDEFHVSGYGLSAHASLDITFFKYFFIQYTFKAGYINMQDIRTTASTTSKASQDFTFFENVYAFGARFNLTKNKNKG